MKDDKTKNGILSVLKNIGEKLPFLQKEEPLYDDGGGGNAHSKDDGMTRIMYIVMSVYGTIAGFISCQYVKYLHQRFACNAWGIPLTSRPVKTYSVANIVVDIVAFMVIYFGALALGAILNRILKIYMEDKVDSASEVANIGLAYGFAFLVVVSVIFFFIRFNIFLLGV